MRDIREFFIVVAGGALAIAGFLLMVALGLAPLAMILSTLVYLLK